MNYVLVTLYDDQCVTKIIHAVSVKLCNRLTMFCVIKRVGFINIYLAGLDK